MLFFDVGRGIMSVWLGICIASMSNLMSDARFPHGYDNAEHTRSIPEFKSKSDEIATVFDDIAPIFRMGPLHGVL